MACTTGADKTNKKASNDHLAPSDSYVSWKLRDAVKIRTAYDSSDPVLVPTLLAKAAREHPDRHALAQCENNQWTYITFREYNQLVTQVAKGFIKIGLEPRSSVAIIGYNSAKWNISYLGAVLANGVTCGMQASFPADTIEYIATLSSVSVAVVHDDEQLSKFISVRQKISSLRSIVHCNRNESSSEAGVYSWPDLLRLGSEVPDEELESRVNGLRANTCCSLILTSGTTGKPKAVMLSHDNLTWPPIKYATYAARAAGVGPGSGSQTNTAGAILSFRPMGHVSSLGIDIISALLSASTVYFADPDHVKDGLMDTLRQVRPTLVFGSPAFWKRIEHRIRLELRKCTRFQLVAVSLARTIGAAGYARLQRGESLPYGWSLADTILFRRVREKLGLDRCWSLLSGGAAISRDLVEFLASFGLHVAESYGMSESIGVGLISSTTPGHYTWRSGSVGRLLPGFVLEVEGKNDSGDGEIYVDGRNVFMGYLENEEQTKRVFDSRWRYRTGDLGNVDGDGFIHITGRTDEMIITSDTTNVHPLPMESAFKLLLPVISNCMIVGDKQDFLAILLCFKSEMDVTGLEPVDAMAAETRDWCHQLGSEAMNISGVAGNKDELVNQAIQRALDKFNEGADRPAKRLRRFYILPRDFSVAGGELGGPLMKMMRSAISKKYEDIIQRLFSSEAEFDSLEIPKI